MKISENLPQFPEENVLLIAAGKTTAKLYFASQKEINELEVVEPHSFDFPDQQGFNIQSGHGESFTWQSFSVNEDWRQKEFLEFLKERVGYFITHGKAEKIYVFAPQEDMNLVFSVIPKEHQVKVEMKIGKNLVNEHPFKLLEKIKKEQKEDIGKSVPLNKEAKKILEKGKE